MIKCSFIYVTTMKNNISYDLRTFLSLTAEKKQSILDYVQLPFHKLIFRHYWQMMSDILKTSYTEAIFKAARPPCIYYSRLGFSNNINITKKRTDASFKITKEGNNVPQA